MSELKYFNQGANYNRLFNNEQFITQLIINIRKGLGRNLLATEKVYLLQLLKNINPVIFQRKKPDEILSIIVEKVLGEIASQPCGETDDDINIHELLKNEIGVGTEDGGMPSSSGGGDVTTQITSSFSNQTEISSFLGAKNIMDLLKIVNPTQVSQTTSILLDTRYRILDDDGTKSFRWNFVNNNNTLQGTVNAIGDIRDIIAIKVFPFKMPYSARADNNYDKITMNIEEFSAQSFIGHEDRKFHFMFDTKVTDRWIKLNARDNNGGIFKFKNPITRIETLTLTFGSPLQPIIFDIDRKNMNIYSYSDANSIKKTTSIISNSPHNLETGDLVYISNFVTRNLVLDSKVISDINNIYGNTITKINNTMFSIDIDTSGLVVLRTGITVTQGSIKVVGSMFMNFTALFSANDTIQIISTSGGVTNLVSYLVNSVNSDTELTLKTPYTGDTNFDTGFYRYTAVDNVSVSVYAGAKRMFIPLELTYNEGNSTNN
jgi:hypothetical protein